MLDENAMLNVLLTNDDGIEAEGLQEMRRALAALEGVRLAVIAPDGNRSAMARSITTRRPLWVAEVPFSDGTVGYATDGTPVDCVRLASLGLVEDFEADLVRRRGSTTERTWATTSPTRAPLPRRSRAWCWGCRRSPSPSSRGRGRWTTASTAASGSSVAAGFVARLVERIEDVPLPARTLLERERAGGRRPAASR